MYSNYLFVVITRSYGSFVRLSGPSAPTDPNGLQETPDDPGPVAPNSASTFFPRGWWASWSRGFYQPCESFEVGVLPFFGHRSQDPSREPRQPREPPRVALRMHVPYRGLCVGVPTTTNKTEDKWGALVHLKAAPRRRAVHFKF